MKHLPSVVLSFFVLLNFTTTFAQDIVAEKGSYGIPKI